MMERKETIDIYQGVDDYIAMFHSLIYATMLKEQFDIEGADDEEDSVAEPSDSY